MQGTGHTTWDGAVLLAKYLEHDYGRGRMKGKRVLETGAGAWFVCWGVVVGGGNFGTLCRPGCLVLPYRFGPRRRFPSTPHSRIHTRTYRDGPGGPGVRGAGGQGGAADRPALHAGEPGGQRAAERGTRGGVWWGGSGWVIVCIYVHQRRGGPRIFLMIYRQAALAGSGARVRVLEGDWFKPPIGAGEADALVRTMNEYAHRCPLSLLPSPQIPTSQPNPTLHNTTTGPRRPHRGGRRRLARRAGGPLSQVPAGGARPPWVAARRCVHVHIRVVLGHWGGWNQTEPVRT